MTPAEKAVAAHFHFEALKSALRQTKEGVAVTFLIQPNDLPSALLAAPIGTRYTVAMCERGNDEQPVQRPEPEPAKPTVMGMLLETEAADHTRPRLSLVGKQRYAEASAMERARIDCVMRCKDPRFWAWAHTANIRSYRVYADAINDEESAAAFVRFCLGKAADPVGDPISRGLIAKELRVYEAWLQLEAKFLADTGQMAESR